jgi:hypothetical protein
MARAGTWANTGGMTWMIFEQWQCCMDYQMVVAMYIDFKSLLNEDQHQQDIPTKW